ncbi:hypothetical protein ACSNKN_13095 [Proteus mirabilis]|uniref:hypothetical protein n=1 Tax=Proteus mirabilis TaxID=584 RepID=UPI003F1B7678
MKFEELPVEVKLIATNTVSDILKTSYPTKESAIEYANSVKSAFVALYNQDSVTTQIGDVTVNSSETVEDVMASFPPDQLSIFHIVKIVNAVNLTIRNELAPYDNDHTDTDEAARTILKTALAALDRQQYLTGRKYGLR